MSQTSNEEIRPILPGTVKWRPKATTDSVDSPSNPAKHIALSSSDSFYPDVSLSPVNESSKLLLIDAVRGIENKSTGWFTKVLIALGSLVIFVAIGAAVWSPKLVGMLAIVLLFHEAGHYIAMRIFGYRNVKMFFIPMLGAAVSGQHFNIAAWKKALVYLAGPVPGIILSLPILLLGMQNETEWLIELGGLALVLNLLNLLPLMPLDGGWIMHLTVFSRSPLLDLAARGVAIVVMIVGGLLLRDRVLIFIAIPLLISLPTTFRVAKLIRRMRAFPIPPPDKDQIPDAAICQIANGMQSTSLGSLPVAQKAPFVLQIYESLVVCPPAAMATLTIWFFYGASFLIGIGGGLAVLLSGQLMRGDFFPPELLAPVEHNVLIDAKNTTFHLGTEPITASHLAIVQASDSEQMATVLDQLPDDRLTAHSHAGFGDTWITSVPREASHDVFDERVDDAEDDIDEDLFDKMREAMRPVDPLDTWLAPLTRSLPSESVFIISGAFNESLVIQCTSPDAATAQAVTKEHFQMAMFGDDLLIPSWSPIDRPTFDQIECRRVLQTLNNGITEETSPKLHQRLTKLSEEYHRERRKARREEGSEFKAFRAYQRNMQQLQRQYAASVVKPLSGNSRSVGQAYLSYQDAIQKLQEEEGERESDYPLLATYLESFADELGRSDPSKTHHHYAAFASGYVISPEDPKPKVQLHVHRATDQAAAVAAIIDFLRERGFHEFELRFTTASKDRDD